MQRTTVLVAVLLLAGCSDAPQEMNVPATPAVTDAGAGTSAVTIDQGVFDRYVDVLEGVEGLRPDGADTDDATDLEDFATGLQVRGEWQDVLEEHGFDDATFVDVHRRIIGAYAKLQMEEHQAEIDRGTQQALEQMRKALGDEQAESMRRQLEAAEQQAQAAFGDVTEETVELVRENRDRLEAALKRD